MLVYRRIPVGRTWGIKGNKLYGKRVKANKEVGWIGKVSLTMIMTAAVVLIVLLVCCVSLVSYFRIYRASIEQNAVTSSEQAVAQVQFMMENYLKTINETMEMIRENMESEESDKNEFLSNLIEIKKDVVAITAYDSNGNLYRCWVGEGNKLKGRVFKNLSFVDIPKASQEIFVSSPHVETLTENYYPWVVTIAQRMPDNEEKEVQVCMDIRFSHIAEYVDNVGIGQHGYCFIMDNQGNLVYHPQQQLINAGLKQENTRYIKDMESGSFQQDNVIYTVHLLSSGKWKIVGVSYVDEMITNKLDNMLRIVGLILSFVLLTTFLVGFFSSKLISNPAKELARAMREFEKDAENFEFCRVNGTRELASLSDSFGHMVVQVQNLMERVREEEVSLRKTELNALQAQINPHFLYNTLDSIAWMCEEGRTQEAINMVNSLARLFRISISKGHELITIEKECQHAESYLQIQKYRYKNKFSYEFEVEPECLTYLCNKITLQPIIENAIYHGLDLTDEGKIFIGVRSQGEDILMYVEDNGVGMEKERCEEILHKESSDRAGIGIKNVNDRIKIYFGEKYGLTIMSEPDVGTRVEIQMPKVLEENHEAE